MYFSMRHDARGWTTIASMSTSVSVPISRRNQAVRAIVDRRETWAAGVHVTYFDNSTDIGGKCWVPVGLILLAIVLVMKSSSWRRSASGLLVGVAIPTRS